MRSGIILAASLVCVLPLHGEQPAKTPPAAAAKAKHPPLHRALFALHAAHEELKESKEEFGGHKKKAEKDIHAAIKSIEAILKHEKDEPAKDAKAPAHEHDSHKKFTSHPHLNHALLELKHAHHYLKESKEDFGGHRLRAMEDIDRAIHEIDDLLKQAKPAEKTKKN